MADLGRWLTGGYAVPGVPAVPDEPEVDLEDSDA